jgi:hypothetical protein
MPQQLFYPFRQIIKESAKSNYYLPFLPQKNLLGYPGGFYIMIKSFVLIFLRSGGLLRPSSQRSTMLKHNQGVCSGI